MLPIDQSTSRREFLQATTAAASLALVAGNVSADTTVPVRLTGPAKSCLLINLVGGPSQLDTFDPKPAASSEIRGPFRPIPTRIPGLYLSELFPKMAAITDRFSLIRSMHHTAPAIHESGFQLVNTGRFFRDGPEWPAIGSVVASLRQPAHFDQGYWVSPSLNIQTGVNVSHGLSGAYLNTPTNLWSEEDSASFRDARMNRYGSTPFGQSCAWAIEAVQRGVAFITLNMYSTVFDTVSWDCHAERGALATTLTDYRDSVAPTFDSAFAALLTDLEQRGLLESTLVVATGEFGRAPRLNANGGRDHWANCWTALIAGGGVHGGRVIGSSDATASEPRERPVSPQQLVATILHACGVPQTATMPAPTGEAVAIYPDKPLYELF